MSVIKLRTLMNDEYLKEYSLIPINYDTAEIWNIVPIAEQLCIVPIIGDELYNELLDQVEVNQVTSKNASLLLLIYPLESMAIVEQAMPYLYMHISEVGITIGKSENSEGASVKDVNYLTEYVKSLMSPLKLKLSNFLEKNKSLYPLYKGITPTPTDKWRVYGFNPVNTDIDGNKMNF